jgi:anti-sigma factor RsiW
MVVNCEHVWREVSNYLDGEVDSVLRSAMDEHVRGCRKCAAVLVGTRNVIDLYGDERMLEVPFGFSQRLRRRLGEPVAGSRRSFVGWMLAAAAACLVLGSVEVVRSFTRGGGSLRSQLAQSAHRIPPDLPVVASEDGRLFHVAGCSFIHEKDRLRTMTAAEATRDGYAPCVRCLKKYLDHPSTVPV